ncbi:unnamed protein product [Mycena citricolor]|uniref:Neutral ceramidase n=1 Tax=Mycena citricolor TaxID=2018698 RepID=A0AAD2K1A9_9AGAR|nr:unnamed protein product [Mycena citricolor]
MKLTTAALTALLSALCAHAAPTTYLLGLGIADVTGPVVETNMMGYASLAQTDTGLHQRQRARAWIVGESAADTAASRVVFVNADIAMGDTGIRRAILAELQTRYGGLYTAQNVAISSTHQHSGVGGYLENLLPQLTALGFVKQSYDAIVAGVVLAIVRAHDSLAPGTLGLGNTTVVGGNINRSPTAYLANPAAERAQYVAQGGDQDKFMSLLNFGSRGFISWFPVHGTSIYENNTLVSTDNKGMAAYLYESRINPTAMPGNQSFIAGFAQANVGDTSPNTLGAFCESPGQPYDGMPCQANSSTCGGTVQDCHGRGPGFRLDSYGFASNTMIAQVQADAAQRIVGETMGAVAGSVRSVHVANHTFTLPNGTVAQTCPPAMGFSFAGGTTDGPGAFDFVQGDNSTSQNPLWNIVKSAVTPVPSAAQTACQYPKPILLNTGYATFPYAWSPSTVDIQMLKIGNVVIALIPGELTTMAGRRLRAAIRAQLIASGIVGNDAYVIISGPANTYAHYITTPEEYTVQRYEGASTIYGPNTLPAYIDKYTSLVPWLASTPPASAPASDAAPPALQSVALSLQTGVAFDGTPGGQSFGSVQTDVAGPYAAGQTPYAVFTGANPRNNLRLEQTFLYVDHLAANGSWTPVRSDSHPSTIYRWARVNGLTGTSTVNISWTVESGTPAGSYRFRYFGDSKALGGTITPFVGTSGTFTVV